MISAFITPTLSGRKKKLMSEVFADIAENIGEESAEKLAEACGGIEIYIPLPKSIIDGHWLVELIGADSAKILAEVYGGGHFKMPLGCAKNSNKNIDIARVMFSHGKSNRDVARHLNVDLRTAERYRARLREGTG